MKYLLLTDPFYGMQKIPMSVLRVLIYDDESWLSEITYE